MNFKEEYKKYNEALCPDIGLVEELKEAARNREERKRKGVIKMVQRGLTVAAACVCIFVGIPVAAANVEPVYQLMYEITPELAQRFRLVQKADEYCGIRMEVISAYICENELMAYLTLQDLEGNRIDETTDLYDSFSIHTPFDGYGSGGTRPIDFDEETGIATFLVTLGQFSGENGENRDIIGKKVTFSVREFISQKWEYDDLEISVDWNQVQAEPKTMSPKLRGGSYPCSVDGREEDKADKSDPRPVAKMLLPMQGDESLPPDRIISSDESIMVDGIYLTGMGYIDGLLHIQTMVPNLLETDNHCELFLVDKEGNRLDCDYKISAFGETGETKETDYQDCIFKISPEELENYTLKGHFVTSGFHMKGSWSVTIPIESQSN